MIDGETGFLTDVALPLIVLAVLAWLIPKAVARPLPEGAGWLVVNGALSACLLGALSGLYVLTGYPDMATTAAAIIVILNGAKSALVWAPVLVLSLADQPRRWKSATW